MAMTVAQITGRKSLRDFVSNLAVKGKNLYHLGMHIMKEQLRLFWEQESKQEAKVFLYQWLYDALMSGIRQLLSVAMTIIRNNEGIIAFPP